MFPAPTGSYFSFDINRTNQHAETQRSKQALEFSKICKRYHEEREIHKKGLELRNSMTPEDQWKSADYKTMIEFKRLRDIQDTTRINAMMASSCKKKKKKEVKQPQFRPPGIPSNKEPRKAMWETYRKKLDPDKPVSPEGYVVSDNEMDDEGEADNDGIDHYSSADDNSQDYDIGRYSSAEDSSAADNNDGRYSSAEDTSAANDNDGIDDSDDELFGGAGLLKSLKKFNI
jgi:hypothetical protein